MSISIELVSDFCSLPLWNVEFLAVVAFALGYVLNRHRKRTAEFGSCPPSPKVTSELETNDSPQAMTLREELQSYSEDDVDEYLCYSLLQRVAESGDASLVSDVVSFCEGHVGAWVQNTSAWCSALMKAYVSANMRQEACAIYEDSLRKCIHLDDDAEDLYDKLLSDGLL